MKPLKKHALAMSVAAFAVAGALAAASQAAEAPAWVQESNQDAAILLKVQARFAPEFAGRTGVEGLDDKIFDLKQGVYERRQKATADAIRQLEAKQKTATDPNVKQDLDILLSAARRDMASSALDKKYMLDFIDAAEVEFSGIRFLLDKQVPPERQKAALTRLKLYAGDAKGVTPFTVLAEQETARRLKVKGLVGPYVQEVQDGIDNGKQYMDGIEQLFKASGLDGWQDDFAKLKQQDEDYNDWLAKNLLPRTRKDVRPPAPIYADNLKQVGVDIPPEQLMAMAQFSFTEIQHQMEALAPQVAALKGYKSTDYRDVIHELKKDQITGDRILPFYQKRLADIEDIIRKEHIVTLPERKASIRLASDAETAQTPAPHMVPPRLIGNTGQYGEFVLPLNLPPKPGQEAEKFDDFTFDAAGWTLTAHEARPGHELQFDSMVEHGVSLARAIFAFNSANAEGWGLYSEAEMQPYEPLDGQLITEQLRLQRAARAFLDPMLNLGMITPEAARQFLEQQVCLSPAFAKSEVERYTFLSPGQATSYYYGYLRLMQLRGEAEVKLGSAFDRQKFNDFILSQGLLPPDLMKKAVDEQFIPSQLPKQQ
ncbi:MAG TPA: DUF885 domain-containing protein [Gammaproteobacteria bacterium]|nr:DUF885 domain-containing protein [Gammaproteobacteria bacterium]